MTVRDPVLDPERQNHIAREGIGHYKDSVRLLLTNLYPNGRIAGDEPYQSKMEELVALLQNHDFNLTMATQDPLDGNRARAQRELLREEQLRREVFSDERKT